MRKTMLLAVLGLAALGAVVTSVYGVLAWYSGYPGITRSIERRSSLVQIESPCISVSQNFTWNFRRGWRWALGDECGRWKVIAKGNFGWTKLELSEEFKEKVLKIANSDEDVQKLFSDGYNVSCIRPVRMKLVVQENGQATIEVDEVLLILTGDNCSRALVEIDFKAERVTKITIVSVTVIDKSTPT
ncbi:MAG: hypothetical protein QXK89_08950 [Candidatus Bathyarchaeia archaeon]